MKKITIEAQKIRLDKWLWAARFFKTRALSLKAIQQGKVLYNAQKPNPSRDVHLEATLKIKQGSDEIEVIVKALSNKRQSALIAQTLYEETPDSIKQRAENAKKRQDQKLLIQSAPHPPKRPEKTARRKMRLLRRQADD